MFVLCTDTHERNIALQELPNMSYSKFVSSKRRKENTLNHNFTVYVTVSENLCAINEER